MIKTLDCTALPCPEPVLKCKACVEEFAPDQIKIVVDNDAAKENVTRFLNSKGYSTELVGKDSAGRWELLSQRGDSIISENSAPDAIEGPAERKDNDRILIFLTSDKVGRGDDELGASLMTNFLATLPELGDDLWRLVLLNSGVKLSIKESPVLDKLKRLEELGVSILVCSSCLDHFSLLDQIGVGQPTNMLDVVTSLQLASKVIRP